MDHDHLEAVDAYRNALLNRAVWIDNTSELHAIQVWKALMLPEVSGKALPLLPCLNWHIFF